MGHGTGNAFGRDESPSQGTQEAVARQIAPHLLARDASSSPSCGPQIGQWRALIAKDLAVLIDIESPLGVEQSARDFDRIQGRLEGLEGLLI